MKWLVKKKFVLVDSGNTEPETNKIIYNRVFDSYVVMYQTSSAATPRGNELEEFIILDGPDTKYPIVDKNSDPLVVIENAPAKTISDAWASMDSSIVTEAASVFSTTNRESMLAFVDSYQLRIIAASQYVSYGLQAHVNTASFTVGDALDTEQKIKDFYTEVLVALDKDRDAKIAAYLAVKNA